jgi:DNA (cytosine-5)-methyltransferase 1
MRYGSVCSGIESATAAWHPLGWQPAFFSEIEAFPRAVLQHRFPDVPLHGDFTTIKKDEYGAIDLLVGGTPCQSFSIAGLRGGLDDDRGNLALEFLRLADRTRPRWVVWENVPGVLSSNGGRDFGSILGGLGELGYGWAYRVLDAQYFGVAQRRRRVFVIGYLGDWKRAAAVLFERHSLSGHPAPRREARKETARAVASGAEERGGCGGEGSSVDWPADVACTLDTDFASKWGQNNQHVNAGCPLFVAQCLTTGTGQRYDAETETLIPTHGGGFDVAAFDWQSGGDSRWLDPKPTAQLQRSQVVAVAYDMRGREGGAQFEGPHDTANIRAASGGSSRSYVAVSAVRRITPVECERLQGFPDNFTAIPYRNKPADQCPDGPRYKALGNSMAVPVMRWIGERIEQVEMIDNG